MKRFIVMLVMLIAFAVTASAHDVDYKVKYTDENGNVRTATYGVYLRDTVEDLEWYKWCVAYFKCNEVFDEDSDIKDLAIVNKLDKQGYTIAFTTEYGDTCYVKANGIWHKFYIHKNK